MTAVEPIMMMKDYLLFYASYSRQECSLAVKVIEREGERERERRAVKFVSCVLFFSFYYRMKEQRPKLNIKSVMKKRQARMREGRRREKISRIKAEERELIGQKGKER